MISRLIADLGPWAWILLGLALMALELLASGVFLIWLGLAALATGFADWGLGLSWQASALLFAVLSVGSVALGRALTRGQDSEREEAGVLNRRGQDLVGREFVLESPIAGGTGRVRVGDSSWRVAGPDAPEGTRVRVVRVDGATLVVERAG